jgi:hypothetical protein
MPPKRKHVKTSEEIEATQNKIEKEMEKITNQLAEINAKDISVGKKQNPRNTSVWKKLYPPKDENMLMNKLTPDDMAEINQMFEDGTIKYEHGHITPATTVSMQSPQSSSSDVPIEEILQEEYIPIQPQTAGTKTIPIGEMQPLPTEDDMITMYNFSPEKTTATIEDVLSKNPSMSSSMINTLNDALVKGNIGYDQYKEISSIINEQKNKVQSEQIRQLLEDNRKMASDVLKSLLNDVLSGKMAIDEYNKVKSQVISNYITPQPSRQRRAEFPPSEMYIVPTKILSSR